VYDSYSVLVGGKAGDGINEAGNLIARLMNRLGYRVYVEVDYPSLIRGGHNYSVIRCAREKVGCRTEVLDVVIALNDETIDRHAHRLRPGGTLIIDTGGVKSFKEGDEVGEALVDGVPVAAILKGLQAPPVMRNTCLLGAFCSVAGIPWDVLEDTIRTHIPRSLELNIAAAKAGYDEAERRTVLEHLDLPPIPVMNGNEAVGLGLLAGGCTAYIAYPMSPATGLLHFMAHEAEKFQLKVVQPENEIAVMLMALGMSYAGQRVAVGSSGGGFCLMVEGVSMSGQAELPVTVMVAQRPGPSTGLPTYTGQSELHFVLNAGQGEFPRVVVAPGTAEDAYWWSAVAIGLSWRFQVSSFVLADKTLCEGSYSIDIDALLPVPQYETVLWDGLSPYRRYARAGSAEATEADEGRDGANMAAAEAGAAASVSSTAATGADEDRAGAAAAAGVPDGVSPLAFPPLPGEVVKVDSYEHDELGVTTEDRLETVLMQEKRQAKWRGLEEEIDKLPAVKLHGEADAPVALVCWGSNGSVCRELGNELGLRVVQPMVLSPFPVAQYERALEGVARVICVENNATGQLMKLLQLHGFGIDDAVRRYDGRSFSLEELRTGVEEVLA
jgi:2-oxoglutarate ferredoxin oxidoreductase subunit alpha